MTGAPASGCPYDNRATARVRPYHFFTVHAILGLSLAQKQPGASVLGHSYTVFFLRMRMDADTTRLYLNSEEVA